MCSCKKRTSSITKKLIWFCKPQKHYGLSSSINFCDESEQIQLSRFFLIKSRGDQLVKLCCHILSVTKLVNLTFTTIASTAFKTRYQLLQQFVMNEITKWMQAVFFFYIFLIILIVLFVAFQPDDKMSFENCV